MITVSICAMLQIIGIEIIFLIFKVDFSHFLRVYYREDYALHKCIDESASLYVPLYDGLIAGSSAYDFNSACIVEIFSAV